MRCTIDCVIQRTLGRANAALQHLPFLNIRSSRMIALNNKSPLWGHMVVHSTGKWNEMVFGLWSAARSIVNNPGQQYHADPQSR